PPERVRDLPEDTRDVLVRANVARGDERARDRLGKLPHVALDPLALVGERELRTAVGEPLGDRPGDRAPVRDSQDETSLSLEHAGEATVPPGMRVAVVTGASSGIGEALSRELRSRGWRVVGLSRRACLAADEQEACDVTDPAIVDGVAARVLERH